MVVANFYLVIWSSDCACLSFLVVVDCGNVCGGILNHHVLGGQIACDQGQETGIFYVLENGLLDPLTLTVSYDLVI